MSPPWRINPLEKQNTTVVDKLTPWLSILILQIILWQASSVLAKAASFFSSLLNPPHHPLPSHQITIEFQPNSLSTIHFLPTESQPNSLPTIHFFPTELQLIYN